jgi:FkbM family methyltransferase
MIEAGLDPSRDVVELGASLGIVSSHIARKLKSGSRLICVEANPALVPSIETNLSRHAGSGVAHQVLNFAITTGKKQVRFQFFEDHTASKRIAGEAAEGQVIQARSLSDLLAELGIQGFTLVCDIEGAEIDILVKDRQALDKCQAMILELHATECDGVQYSVEELKKMIVQDLSFDLVQDEGPVCFFKRRIISR